MGYISINVNEDLLRNILGMPREGIRLVVKRTCIMEFFKEYSKISTTHCAGLFQKFMKGEYQLALNLSTKFFFLEQTRGSMPLTYSLWNPCANLNHFSPCNHAWTYVQDSDRTQRKAWDGIQIPNDQSVSLSKHPTRSSKVGDY